MTNCDYLCTLDVDSFHLFLCTLSDISPASMWGQILKSWLTKEVDDQFFSSTETKQKFIENFKKVAFNKYQSENKQPKDFESHDIQKMFEDIFKYLDSKYHNNEE